MNSYRLGKLGFKVDRIQTAGAEEIYVVYLPLEKRGAQPIHNGYSGTSQNQLVL